MTRVYRDLNIWPKMDVYLNKNGSAEIVFQEHSSDVVKALQLSPKAVRALRPPLSLGTILFLFTVSALLLLLTGCSYPEACRGGRIVSVHIDDQGNRYYTPYTTYGGTKIECEQ